MAQSVSVDEARRLIDGGNLDIIDVRQPHEYNAGYIPGARNIPLDDVQHNTREHLKRDRILLVCARGIRSQVAARLADAIGLQEVYQLEGGIYAWIEAGWKVDKPDPAHASQIAMPTPPANCGLPTPGLDVVVGSNMRKLRKERNITLDQLAQLTELSRTLLGQVELGKISPSVSMVWKIAHAFQIPFSALLATSQSFETTVLRATDAKRLVSPDGRFSSRALYPLADTPGTEFYELFLAAHSREDAQAHQIGTREHLVVTNGQLELLVGSECFSLGKGDAIVFTADLPHSYINPVHEDCWMYLVMTYST